MGSINYSPKNWCINKIAGKHKITGEEVLEVIVGEGDYCDYHTLFMTRKNYQKAKNGEKFETLS